MFVWNMYTGSNLPLTVCRCCPTGLIVWETRRIFTYCLQRVRGGGMSVWRIFWLGPGTKMDILNRQMKNVRSEET